MRTCLSLCLIGSEIPFRPVSVEHIKHRGKKSVPQVVVKESAFQLKKF